MKPIDLSTITFTVTQIISIVFLLNALIVLVIILLDRRSPQSAYAWLLLMLGFPGIGLLIYIFFGRGYKAFSDESKLARIGGLSTPYGLAIQPLVNAQNEYAEKIRLEKPNSYRGKLLHLLYRNSHSFLTGYNHVEILQDVNEKYRRLLEDVRAAQSSIHLLYYIWTEDPYTLELKDALIEIWQADGEGRYAHPADPRGSNVGFKGFGRTGTGTDVEQRFIFDTIKPGSVDGKQAPHINVVVFMRGLPLHAFTRIYFSDEVAANARDPVLATVPAERQDTLIAKRDASAAVYRVDIHMQGAQATVFFDV